MNDGARCDRSCVRCVYLQVGRDEAAERHGPLQQQGGSVGHQRIDAQAPYAGQVGEAQMESLTWEGKHVFNCRTGAGWEGMEVTHRLCMQDE